MGGWYASIQCRGEDRTTLLSLVESLATEKGLQFLCGPVLDGWIGV